MKKKVLRQLLRMSSYFLQGLIIQTCCFSVLLAAESSAQRIDLREVRITVKFENDDIFTVINKLEKVSEFRFAYNKSDLKHAEQVTGSFNNQTMYEILTQISRQANVKFRQVNSSINVTLYKNETEGTAAVEIIQTRRVSGKVTDAADQSPLPGVNIIEKGTMNGTVTDFEGNYSLQVDENAMLVYSFVGYLTQETAVGNRTVIDVALAADVKALEEIVVIGYGVQEKKLVTGATLNVSGEEIQNRNSTNALQALQGQTPGVSITSRSGQPGEDMRVIIRGVGTIGNAGPLYIVDGVQTDDISYLNAADIESIDVLKDAASAAIYGSRAANGVILVTTRQGTSGKAQISLDGYAGIQNLSREIDMLNSREYATIMNEQAVNSGKLPYFTSEQIAEMGNGTDWLDEMFFRNAATQNYSLGISGGNGPSVYSTSLSYTQQSGIVGGRDWSNYERYGFRVNSEHGLLNNDILKIGEHLTFTWINRNGIEVAGQYNNTLRGAFNTNPFIPVYDENGEFFDNSESDWNNGAANPYASMVYNNQNDKNRQKLIGDVYLELTPVKNLKFRSVFGADYYSREERSFKPVYRLSIYTFNDFTEATQKMERGLTWNLDNLMSYSLQINDHQVEAMAGMAARKFKGTDLYGKNTDLTFNELKYAYLSNTTNTNSALFSLTGKPSEDQLLSYFGRVIYNFREKYMFNATFRADGSSKFAKGNRWGYFPSLSAGWVITSEPFMENAFGRSNFLKIRASWGQNGNQNIDPHQYLATIMGVKSDYIFGNEEGTLTPGAYPNRLSNPDLKWETSEQVNIGFDAEFLNNKLSANFDWYNKTTKDWLIIAPILATAGADAPFINGGNVENKGIELALNWRDNMGSLNYSLGANLAYNKNNVTEVPTNDGIIHGADNVLWNNGPEFYRAQSGYPVGYFWGYKTLGVFQNEAEVNAYRYDEGGLIQPNAKPGDLTYFDANGEGGITNEDKVNIGDPNPDYIFGFNVMLNYLGFDFSVSANGVAGNQLIQSYRNQVDQNANYFKTILGRWHGEGSSNSMPRLTEDAKNYTEFSDIYVQDGDFLRINNVVLGYDLSKLIRQEAVSQMRIYVAAQNLYTFTRYDGMDPEIGYGHDGGITDKFSSGLDLGYYPRPRTFLVGLNVKF